jgi:hypothetical protein
MSQYPFARAPGLFFITYGNPPECVKIVPYESPWGTTDENLCFVDDVLIGLLNELDPADINLVPSLDRLRDYPWPTAAALCDALDLLLSETKGWRLRCEGDCDQAPVEHVRSLGRLRFLLSRTVDACMSGDNEIPNFAASDATCGD